MMKSDGFYCLDVNGAGSTQAEIHYFQDYEIDGTVFDGYYYHDTDGKFKACSPHIEHLKGVAVFGDKTDEEADTQNAQEAEKFDGYYFVNNLGRLSAAPQVRYIDNLAIDGITLNGYYYFDENGRLVTEPGIHSLEMDCYEINFDGSYYFGGTNGALLQADEAKKLNTADTKTVDVKLNDLLWNMITVSDNESCNELVKLQKDSLDFKKGAEDINKYLEKEGYTETSVQHTLHPAASAQESLGGRNMTSVKDCGTLLEKIYKGECVSKEASVKSGKHLENPPGTSGWNKICQQDRRDRPGSARYRNCLWRKDNLYPMCDV